MMKMLSGWHIIVMIKTFCLPMGHKEVISIQWFHTANNGMISQMTSSFSSKLLQTPPPSSKWWVISYYNTTNAFIGMHSLCLWGSGLILAETREDPFTLYALSSPLILFLLIFFFKTLSLFSKSLCQTVLALYQDLNMSANKMTLWWNEGKLLKKRILRDKTIKKQVQCADPSHYK